MNNSKLSLPNVIGGVTGSNNIVNMWKSHYEDLFNCLAKDTKTDGLCQNVEYDLDVEVSHPEVINAIQELSDNKSCGLDGTCRTLEALQRHTNSTVITASVLHWIISSRHLT